MQRAFVESMKTIAQSAIEKAGFDKTRNGKIVGVNSLTNTYSVKVDGIIYNNVKAVNDMTCNVGDTVKVNIPMNNPSQAYITSSILSDESIGQKIAQATTAIDNINNQIESITEISNIIYQLSIDVSYANDGNYKNITYTAMLMQDGVNVTEDHEASEFRWYLEKTTGTEELSGSPARAVVLSTRDYFYGQSILLEWTYVYTDVASGEQKTAQLRSRVTLISNDAIRQVAKYTTEVTNGGVFVHRADGNYDVGADWESVWAYGVKISDTVDIIKGGKIYGSFGGNYLTVGNTSENNIYMDSSSFIQLRQGNTVLTDVRPGSITLGRSANGYYNTYMDSSNIKFRRQLNNIIYDLLVLNSDGLTTYNTNNQSTAFLGSTIRLGIIGNNYTRLEMSSDNISAIYRSQYTGDYPLMRIAFTNNSSGVIPNFTFGTRSTGTIGSYSLSAGSNHVASGMGSAVVGGNGSVASGTDSAVVGGSANVASGTYSFAQNLQSTASGYASHAGGFMSTASGYCAFVHGTESTASGGYSVALGHYLKASYSYQTVIGKYNVAENKMFIIGNGSWDQNRINIFTVDTSGTVNIPSGQSYTIGGNRLIRVATCSVDNLKVSKTNSVSGTITPTSYTGYTPVGVIGYNMDNGSSSGTGVSLCHLFEMTLSSNKVAYQVRNSGSSDAKIKITARVLYVRSEIEV